MGRTICSVAKFLIQCSPSIATLLRRRCPVSIDIRLSLYRHFFSRWRLRHCHIRKRSLPDLQTTPYLLVIDPFGG